MDIPDTLNIYDTPNMLNIHKVLTGHPLATLILAPGVLCPGKLVSSNNPDANLY